MRRGELIERAKVERAMFDFARRMRDAWAGWPPRVAATIAARDGADPYAVKVALAAEVRRLLVELSDRPVLDLATGERGKPAAVGDRAATSSLAIIASAVARTAAEDTMLGLVV